MAPTHRVSYENIWIDPVARKPQIQPEVTPPPVPPRLRSKQPSFLARSSNEDSAISSSASSSSNDVHVLSSNLERVIKTHRVMKMLPGILALKIFTIKQNLSEIHVRII